MTDRGRTGDQQRPVWGHRRMWRLVLIHLVLMGSVTANASEVDTTLQAKILLRALTLDRSLKSRAGGMVSFGIVYVPGNLKSETVMKGITAALRGLSSTPIQGLVHETVPLKFRSVGSLAAEIKKHDIDYIYLCPGLDDELQAIVAYTFKEQIPTLTGTVSYLRAGVALGVGIKQKKPKLAVNMKAAKATGMNLSSLLMRVADVVE